ncbi:MAG: LysM peptidoglycan-binding domain-containing protein [Bacteroidales bacterium]|jgi:LysM repeat protein/lysophospholipase L1-like esterase|nr:LysM peptidoglycan-binding domain-containing protein [Bacteroidales bacterium]MDD4215078.1 LysM peptidoglycan-binding domain-containing protein [Bacteroidales bacterium]
MLRSWYKKTAFSFLLLAVTLLLVSSAYINPVFTKKTTDPLVINPQYVDSLIKYRAYYPFIRYEINFIEWQNVTAVRNFFQKVSQTGTRKLKILHIGDSHIQADIPSGYIRERLQEVLGYGGRGLIFPYKAAATHAAYDYKTSCTGKWDYNKSIHRDIKYDMGLIGATVYTNDSNASFKITFREGFIRENFTLIKIYCKQDSLSFDLKVKTNQGTSPVHIDCNDVNSGKPYVSFQISNATDTLEVFVNKTEKKQTFFECYGLMIESNDDKGILYCSTGINGAGYRSLLRQNAFGQQLTELQPDLVIIDFGANDFYRGAYNDKDMEANLVKIIDIIQNASPETSILISNAQNIYARRKYNVPQCKDFMEMTKRVAGYRNCAFYDYYNVSGGNLSMNKWLKYGLARNDKVHLSAPGYYIRGELYLNAILNSYACWLQNQEEGLIASNHVIDTLTLKKYFSEDINFTKENTKTQKPVAYNNEEVLETDDNNITYYKIRSGDNLGSIAERFGVKVSQLQYWNGLSGTKIIAGETLIIYKGAAKATPQNPQKESVQGNNKKPVTTATLPANKRKIVYKVNSGDTLWAIAKKYNTSIEIIKQANNLKSDKLSIGQTLIIP